MFKLKYFDSLDEFCSIYNNPQFLHLMKSKWDQLHQENNIFRYKIDNVRERLVDDKYLLQLNPDRSTKRRIPEQIDNICQQFEENKFNFTKISPKEIILKLVKENDESDGHLLLVNVSPISRYHSLLCPSVEKRLPQIVTADSLKLAIEILYLAQDRDLRIGYNSLCALASVNHLHYHLFLEKNTLPIEYVKCKHIIGPLYCLNEDYPVPAFCFTIQAKDSISALTEHIYKLVEYLLKNSIAHNILMSRGENVGAGEAREVVRVLVWPRKSSHGAKQLAAFNVAVCELSGWFPIYSIEDFVSLQCEDLENELKKWKINDFDDLCEKVKSLF